jgi:hypothetical protein
MMALPDVLVGTGRRGEGGRTCLSVCSMLCGRFYEVGEGRFERVVGTDYIDVDDGFEGVCRESANWCEEVACCSGTIRVSVFNG